MTKEEAVAILKNLPYLATKSSVEDIERAICLAIKALEQEPCEDAISRDAVIEHFRNALREVYDRNDIIYELEYKIPPVTPSRRKGRWIIKDRYYHDTVTAECSECGREVEIPTCMSELMYKGCPYCLAEMVEPQESEDKE